MYGLRAHSCPRALGTGGVVVTCRFFLSPILLVLTLTVLLACDLRCLARSRLKKEQGMHQLKFPVLSKGLTSAVAALTMVAFLVGSTLPTLAMDALPGGALPQPLPLFPPGNWWNLDISNSPVDVN